MFLYIRNFFFDKEFDKAMESFNENDLLNDEKVSLNVKVCVYSGAIILPWIAFYILMVV